MYAPLPIFDSSMDQLDDGLLGLADGVRYNSLCTIGGIRVLTDMMNSSVLPAVLGSVPEADSALRLHHDGLSRTEEKSFLSSRNSKAG